MDDRAEIARMHTELGRVGLRLERWMHYAQQLAGIMREAGLIVPPSPDEAAELASSAGLVVKAGDAEYNRAALLRRMERAFNLDELRDLAFRFGVDTGDLAGDTFSARAQALITYAARRDRLAELVGLCRQVRPEGRF
jgi:hypothetical protein